MPNGIEAATYPPQTLHSSNITQAQHTMTSQYFRSRLSSLREYLTPVTHTSTFATTGEITPEEFVHAGDYLVHRFPTWQWSPVADESKRRTFLPDDKQFLVTRHVPSYVRAADYELVDPEIETKTKAKTETKADEMESSSPEDGDDTDDDDEWAIAGSTDSARRMSAKLADDSNNEGIDEASIKEVSSDEEEDLQDIDELIDEDAEDVDFIDTKQEKEQNLHSTKKRYYDLYISYSTSYRVPKMYLVGFDSDSVPLTPHQMFEDIASDYRHKTVTIEKLPFTSNTTSVSIHPCKHANVMKVLMRRAAAAAKERSLEHEASKMIKKISKLGINKDNDNTSVSEDEGWEGVEAVDSESQTESTTSGGGADDTGIRADQYLVVFLKFMSSVTPGIEHDYTMDAL